MSKWQFDVAISFLLLGDVLPGLISLTFWKYSLINTWWSEQNGRHFTNDNFKSINKFSTANGCHDISHDCAQMQLKYPGAHFTKNR